MFTNITIGKYLYKDSIIHKLHPLFKLISLLLIIILTLISNIYFNILILFLLFIPVYMSKIEIKTYLKNILSIKYFLIFLFIINFIFNTNIIITINSLLKLIIIIIYTSIYMYTTTIVEINYSLKKILSLFKIIDTDKYSLMITLSIKFIYLIIEETNQIISSLIVKGLDYRNNIKEKIKTIKMILIPLFINGINKADNISDIIEVRNYDINKVIKNINIKINLKDIIFLILNILLFILIIIFEVII